MFKDREQIEKYLKNYTEKMGFISINQAAQYVVDNYKDYDYKGGDAVFISHCEDIASEMPGHKLTKYTGLIEEYFETGMECIGFIFHDNRGNHEALKYNNPEEIMTYHSISWALWFNKYCIHFAKIFDDEGQLVYEGKLTRNAGMIAQLEHMYSFVPREIPLENWIEYCKRQYKMELWTNEIPYAIKEKFGKLMPWQVGSLVWDELTNKKNYIVNMTYTLESDGSPGTVGYWVNDKYLDGGRHPWELTDIPIDS